MRKFFKNSCGATSIEYAIIASLASIVIITALIIVRNNIEQTYSGVASKVEAANNGGKAKK